VVAREILQNALFIGGTPVIMTEEPSPIATTPPLKEAIFLNNQYELLLVGYDGPAQLAEGRPLVDVPACQTVMETTHMYFFHGTFAWILYLAVPLILCCQAGCSKHTSFPLGLLSLADLLGLYYWTDAVRSKTIWLLFEPGVAQVKQFPTIHSVSLPSNHPCANRLVTCLSERSDEVEARPQSLRKGLLSGKQRLGLHPQQLTRPDHTMSVRYATRTLQRWRTNQHRWTQETVDKQASRLMALAECRIMHREYGSCSRCVPHGAAQMQSLQFRYVTVAIVIQMWKTITMWSLDSRSLLSSSWYHSQPLMITIPEITTSPTACLPRTPRHINL
jgi:hypothetical protein